MFLRNVLIPSSGSKNKPSKKLAVGRFSVVHRRFRGMYRLHLYGLRLSRASKQTNKKYAVPSWHIRPRRWRRYDHRNVGGLNTATTWRYGPKDRTLHSHRCQKLKYHINYNVVFVSALFQHVQLLLTIKLVNNRKSRIYRYALRQKRNLRHRQTC
jgi:hypothetical protein